MKNSYHHNILTKIMISFFSMKTKPTAPKEESLQKHSKNIPIFHFKMKESRNKSRRIIFLLFLGTFSPNFLL